MGQQPARQLDYLRWLLTACNIRHSRETEKLINLENAEIFNVDLRSHCNQGFEDSGVGGAWFDLGTQLDLRNITPGKAIFSGIEFEIIDPKYNHGKSCITLNGRRGEYFPRETGPVEIHQTFDYIAFHHASAYANPGELLGTYVIHYSDGSVEKIHVFEGLHVQDWYNGPTVLSDAQAAWSGKTLGNRDVSTYCFLWKNPKPRSTIDRMMIYAGDPDEKDLQGVLQHGMLAVVSITGIQTENQ